VNEKNPKAIKKAIFLKTQTQLRRFLGMCNVYRRFTVDFAKTAKPRNDLNSVKLSKRLSPPTPEEQAAFDKLRQQLCHPPILAIPREEGRNIIHVIASYDQLGFCLLQQQPDGKYLPVGYFSKGLLPAEKNSTVTEIEGLGVVWAVGLLRPYLYDSDQLDSRFLSSIWGARRCCGAVPNPKSLNGATWSICETRF